MLSSKFCEKSRHIIYTVQYGIRYKKVNMAMEFINPTLFVLELVKLLVFRSILSLLLLFLFWSSHWWSVVGADLPSLLICWFDAFEKYFIIFQLNNDALCLNCYSYCVPVIPGRRRMGISSSNRGSRGNSNRGSSRGRGSSSNSSKGSSRSFTNSTPKAANLFIPEADEQLL